MTVSLRRRFHLPKDLVRDWFYLALEKLSRLMVGRTSAVVAPGRIDVATVVKTPSKNQMDLSLSLTIGDDQQWLESPSEGQPRDSHRTSILPRPERRSSSGLRATMRMAAARPEQSEKMKKRTLDEVFQVFEDALGEVKRDIRKPYVVAIVFRPGVNWPLGRFEFGDYLLASIDADSWEGPHVLLAKKVTAFSQAGCRAGWHDRLNRIATLIAVLADRTVKLEREYLPNIVTDALDVPNFYPLAEREEDSKVLGFAAELGQARSGSAYGKSPDVYIIPEDLGAMVARYETLPPKQHTIIDDALSALQVGLELREEMPTLALCAFLTALERLVDWKSIPKAEGRCPGCGQTKSKTQEAILELMDSVLKINQPMRASVADVLREARKAIRIPWVHQGRLAGDDFVSPSEIWVASTAEDAPDWAKIDHLRDEIEDFLRQLLVKIFEEMR